ncbi:MAG: hypothetical protein LBE33_09935 [Zoogloeaceae bacterium]|jgi:hypothetical protein|nr:hypothetical protein [Zoogloeaceae bacterium]
MDEIAPDAEKVSQREKLRRAAATLSALSSAPPPPPTYKTHNQLREIQTFFNETIRETLGLRGFALQLKVEKAGTLEDFRALRTPYVEAVRNRKGDLIAEALAERLDALLS